jgi:CDP-6-deoxy-D-xylo-4-hexulose-3-dehydrase
MFYDLAADTWGPEEHAAVERVLASRKVTMGPEVKAFEEAFAAWHGSRHAIMVNSGSSANLIALGAFFFRKSRPLERGDEVLVPAIAWSTTYAPLQQYGLRVRFVDVELDTLNVDMAQLEAAITPRTRAIVAVSILGNPAALDAMRRLADARGLALIEDNCESLGAELEGKKTGTFGHVGTFSFFFSHHVTTGEGGMVITDDDELADLVRSLRAHGWTRDLPVGSTIYQRGDDDFFEAYRFVLPGYNVRPMEFQGAVGLAQMEKIDGFLATRRKNLATFQRLFAGDPRFVTPRENGTSSSFSFPIVLNTRTPRNDVFSALQEAGIAFRIVTGGCFPRHDAVRYFDFDTWGPLPNAQLAHDRGFFVGNHPYDLRDRIEKLFHVLDGVCS